MVNRFKLASLGLVMCLSILAACTSADRSTTHPQNTAIPTASIIHREVKIPSSTVKLSPTTDEHPLELYSSEYEAPVPLTGEVNTAGAEDSPFIIPDGNTLYFFFTPDVKVPVEQQLLDGVTGLYVAHKVNGVWGAVERVWLQDPDQLSLDGCEYVHENVIWFCSTREGLTGLHWLTAEYLDGRWQGWKLADFEASFQVGELHLTADGNQVYFGSERPGGKGGMDLWVSQQVNGMWQEPVNMETVNTADSEGWPALNPAEDELWFNRNYGIWRSKLVNGEWQTPELVVSPLAGEPTLDADGNLYFVHHYFHGDEMIEADIYIAERR